MAKKLDPDAEKKAAPVATIPVFTLTERIFETKEGKKFRSFRGGFEHKGHYVSIEINPEFFDGKGKHEGKKVMYAKVAAFLNEEKKGDSNA